MKIFLKALDKLKKSESSEQECKYDKGWNDAIKKMEPKKGQRYRIAGKFIAETYQKKDGTVGHRVKVNAQKFQIVYTRKMEENAETNPETPAPTPEPVEEKPKKTTTKKAKAKAEAAPVEVPF